jgi:hypothetical protein
LISSSAAGGIGSGGNIQIAARNVDLNFGLVNAISLTSGDAGSITVHADNLNINKGGILAGTFGTGTLSKGGDVTIIANLMNISHTGIIDVRTLSDGDAGKISVDADKLRIASGATISSNTEGGAGNGGDVLLKANSIVINGAGAPSHQSTGVSATSMFSIGNAGDVTLRAADLRMLNGGRISTDAGLSNGGNVHIKAQDLVYLLGSRITAKANSGIGGNITIDPVLIALNHSLITASAPLGQGGHIELASDFFLDSNTPITATGGVANGTVNITAPPLDLGAQLITLPSSLVSAANQLQERCTALLQGDFSSFISIGRGGTEPEPEELQSEF